MKLNYEWNDCMATFCTGLLTRWGDLIDSYELDTMARIPLVFLFEKTVWTLNYITCLYVRFVSVIIRLQKLSHTRSRYRVNLARE